MMQNQRIFLLSGKITFVTGATEGIDQSIAEKYWTDEKTFKTDTDASSKEVENIKSNVNQINPSVQGAKHVTVENEVSVTYLSDAEVDQ